AGRRAVRRRAGCRLPFSRIARRLGQARMAAALDAARRRHSLDRSDGAPPRAQLRARDQRVLSHRHRPAPDRLASHGAQGGQRLAVQTPVVRRALRAARAPSAGPLSAARNDRILMSTFARLFRRPKPETLATRAAYELWAPGYPPVAHNPLMRAEQRAVEEVLRLIAPTRAL